MKHKGCVFALSLLGTAQVALALPPEELLGCWKADRIVQHFADGSSFASTAGQCRLQFTGGEFVSSCIFSKMTSTSYRYRVVRPNVYVATMTATTARSDLIGTSREQEFRVQGSKLSIITTPRVPEPTPPTAVVRIESESTRIACE